MLHRQINKETVRDTNRISTRFFVCQRTCHDALSTKNREKVSVSVFFTVVTVKMRQKHPGWVEYARGPPHNVQTDTSLVWDHTYQWGPSVSKDFSILNNSPSPTPELQYIRDGTSQYVHSKCTLVCSRKSGSRQESLSL